VDAVDITALDRTGPSGAIWSLPHGGDLDANVVVLVAGASVDSHVNDEVDVLVVTVAGSGTVSVDGDVVELSPSIVVHVPKGATRQIRAGDETLVYLTVHRARSGLSIGRR
jgi:quercetin dioxygenase-like cupin family protein